MPISEHDGPAGLLPEDSAGGAAGEVKQTDKDSASASSPKFVSWKEQPLNTMATAALGRRKLIKKRNVSQGTPRTIIPEYNLEPEPAAEIVEITPLKEDDVVVGLRLVCSCAAVHEVQFEFDDES